MGFSMLPPPLTLKKSLKVFSKMKKPLQQNSCNKHYISWPKCFCSVLWTMRFSVILPFLAFSKFIPVWKMKAFSIIQNPKTLKFLLRPVYSDLDYTQGLIIRDERVDFWGWGCKFVKKKWKKRRFFAEFRTHGFSRSTNRLERSNFHHHPLWGIDLRGWGCKFTQNLKTHILALNFGLMGFRDHRVHRKGRFQILYSKGLILGDEGEILTKIQKWIGRDMSRDER